MDKEKGGAQIRYIERKLMASVTITQDLAPCSTSSSGGFWDWQQQPIQGNEYTEHEKADRGCLLIWAVLTYSRGNTMYKITQHVLHLPLLVQISSFSSVTWLRLCADISFFSSIVPGKYKSSLARGLKKKPQNRTTTELWTLMILLN